MANGQGDNGGRRGPGGAGGGDDEFGEIQGLPIDAWISAPLLATSRSNSALAETTIEFVERMAYVDADDPSKGPRLLTFQVERKYKKPTEEGFGSETLTIEAPVLALLPIPALLVDEVQIDFTTTVQRAYSSSAASDAKGKGVVDSKKVVLAGGLSVHSEQSRKSDYRATYTFRLRASQQPATEGMNRLTDMMAEIMTPTSKE